MQQQLPQDTDKRKFTYFFNILMSASAVPHEKVPLLIIIASTDSIEKYTYKSYYYDVIIYNSDKNCHILHVCSL